MSQMGVGGHTLLPAPVVPSWRMQSISSPVKLALSRSAQVRGKQAAWQFCVVARSKSSHSQSSHGGARPAHASQRLSPGDQKEPSEQELEVVFEREV